MRANQTSFERFEHKFWISEPRAEQLLRSMTRYLRCDDWAQGGQVNTSLYLDTPRLDFAHLHTDKAPSRFKLRVRAYGAPPTNPAFFEIKRKVKAVTLKRRAIVPLACVTQLLRGEMPPDLKLGSAEEEQTLSQFLYLMIAYRAEPTLLVRARRQAYTSLQPDDGVRLTIDRDICYQRALEPSLLGGERAWMGLCGLDTYLPEAPVLIEIKFRGRAPFWVGELIQNSDLRRTRFSKYIAAVQCEALGREGVSQLARIPAWPGSAKGEL